MIHLKHRDRHGGIWRVMEGSVIQGRNKWKHVKTKRIVHETRWEEMRRWKMFPSILEGFLSLPREGPICFRSLDFMVNEALISSECLWKIRFNMFKFCFYDVTWSLAEWFYNHITHNNICYIFLQMGSKQKHDHRLSSPGLWLFWREGGSLSGGNTQFLTRSLTALWSFMHLPTFWLHLQTTFETRCMLIIISSISSERWQSFDMWLWLRVPGFTNLLRVFTSFFVMLFILN